MKVKLQPAEGLLVTKQSAPPVETTLSEEEWQSIKDGAEVNIEPKDVHKEPASGGATRLGALGVLVPTIMGVGAVIVPAQAKATTSLTARPMPKPQRETTADTSRIKITITIEGDIPEGLPAQLRDAFQDQADIKEETSFGRKLIEIAVENVVPAAFGAAGTVLAALITAGFFGSKKEKTRGSVVVQAGTPNGAFNIQADSKEDVQELLEDTKEPSAAFLEAIGQK